LHAEAFQGDRIEPRSWPAASDARNPPASASRDQPEAPVERPNLLHVDVAIAIVAAILILTITPGPTVASIIAMAV
jgi:hypothetical protein